MPSSFREFSAGSFIGPGKAAPRRGVRKQIAQILSFVDKALPSDESDGAEEIYRAIRKF